MITKELLKSCIQGWTLEQGVNNINKALEPFKVKNLPQFPDLGFVGELTVGTDYVSEKRYRIVTPVAIQKLEKFVNDYRRDWYQERPGIQYEDVVVRPMVHAVSTPSGSDGHFRQLYLDARFIESVLDTNEVLNCSFFFPGTNVIDLGVTTKRLNNLLRKKLAQFEREPALDAGTLWNVNYLGNAAFNTLKSRADVLLSALKPFGSIGDEATWTGVRDRITQELHAHVQNTQAQVENNQALHKTNYELARELDNVRQKLKEEREAHSKTAADYLRCHDVGNIQADALKNLRATSVRQSASLAAALKEKNDAIAERHLFKQAEERALAEVRQLQENVNKLNDALMGSENLRIRQLRKYENPERVLHRSPLGYDVRKQPIEAADCITLVCHHCANGVPVNPRGTNWLHTNGSFCKAYVIYNALAAQRKLEEGPDGPTL